MGDMDGTAIDGTYETVYKGTDGNDQEIKVEVKDEDEKPFGI